MNKKLLPFSALAALCAALAACAVSPVPVASVAGLSAPDIPAVLLEAQKQPYALPVDGSCNAIAAQVQALDAALGPDLDVPASASNPGLIERGAGDGGNLVTDTIRSSAEGAIPYGGWMRKLSGADKAARNAQAAITAGAIRRGFLKGLKTARACA